MWWLVWGVLVLGTLVGAFFLFRDLYRKGKALAGEMGVLADRVEALSAKAEELKAQLGPLDVHNPLALTPMQRQDIRSARAARKASRRRQKAERHAQTRATWRTIAG